MKVSLYKFRQPLTQENLMALGNLSQLIVAKAVRDMTHKLQKDSESGVVDLTPPAHVSYELTTEHSLKLNPALYLHLMKNRDESQTEQDLTRISCMLGISEIDSEHAFNDLIQAFQFPTPQNRKLREEYKRMYFEWLIQELQSEDEIVLSLLLQMADDTNPDVTRQQEEEFSFEAGESEEGLNLDIRDDILNHFFPPILITNSVHNLSLALMSTPEQLDADNNQIARLLLLQLFTGTSSYLRNSSVLVAAGGFEDPNVASKDIDTAIRFDGNTFWRSLNVKDKHLNDPLLN